MVVLAIALSLLTITAISFQGIGLWFTFKFFQQSLSASPTNFSTTQLPVSILIPVRGIDEGALENWLSLCQQDYPDYDIWFGVMDVDDPAVSVLQQVVAQFPDRAHLLTNLPARGINHQISNLSYLVEASQNEIVIFADSDIRVTPAYLREVTRPLVDERVGLVTCTYVDYRPRHLGAALAALGRSLDFIPSVLIARAWDNGLKFALGPTIVLRRSVLQQFGGLKKVLNRIGSDFHLGRLTVEAGYRVELSTYILDNDCGEQMPQQVFQRELRWFRTIRANRGSEYYGLVFTHGIVYSSFLLLVGLLSKWNHWTVFYMGLGVIAWGLRFLQGYLILSVMKLVGVKPWLWVLPLRDAMTFWIWLKGTYGRDIFWRGRWLTISGRGQLQEKR
ncbi:MAG: glycosyltransferase [Elainellaceae cyanobacterium]